MSFSSAFPNVLGDMTAPKSQVFPWKGLSLISVEERKDQGGGAVREDEGAKPPLGIVDVISLTKSFWKKL